MLSLATTLRTLPRRISLPSARLQAAAAANIHTTAPTRAYKDDQDRESLNPKAPYGSQSKGEEAASHNPDAYSRGKTDPAKVKRDNPEDLEVSGANQGLSKPQGDDAGKESRPVSTDKQRRSGGKTSAGKAGKPNV